MMRSNVLLLFFIFIMAQQVSSQNNVNVDNYGFDFTYRSLPSKPLTPIAFYYGINVNAPRSIARSVNLKQLSNNLLIEGQRYTDDLRSRDVIVTLDLGDVEIVDAIVVEREGDWIDEKNKRKGKRRYYKMEVSYTFESKVSLGQDGRKSDSYTLYYRTSKQKYTTQEYRSRGELSNYWKNNREVLRERFAQDLVQTSIDKASKRLSEVYGFSTTKTSDIIKTINEKKHPENLAFRSASDQLKIKLEAMDAYSPMLEEEVVGLIDYYEGILDRYTDPKLKADVRLCYAALYNLCKIYLYLDQPEKVKPYADQILENGHDTGDCKRMNEAASKLMSLFSISDMIKTRHFDPELLFPE